MNWTAPIDDYCERLGPGFWAEPLNAWSNLAFALAALWALAIYLRRDRAGRPVLALIGIVFSIAIGSFLFHTFANRWSVLADVIPITIFIYSFLGFALRRFFRLGWLPTIAALIAFVGTSVLVTHLISGLVGSSAGYVPPLLALAAEIVTVAF